jgi:hypothetical protein
MSGSRTMSLAKCMLAFKERMLKERKVINRRKKGNEN